MDTGFAKTMFVEALRSWDMFNWEIRERHAHSQFIDESFDMLLMQRSFPKFRADFLSGTYTRGQLRKKYGLTKPLAGKLIAIIRHQQEQENDHHLAAA